MIKNRSRINRNLSLEIFYQEQFNYLSFTIFSWIISLRQWNLAFSNYIKNLNDHIYNFLHSRSYINLLPEEIVHLMKYYINLWNCISREINLNRDVNRNITKWAWCLLAEDIDAILSNSHEERHDAINERAFFIIRFSQLNDDEWFITQYAKIIHFFVHKFRESEEMLTYIQIYHFIDHSLEWSCIQENKIIRLNREGLKEIMSITALNEGIEIMKRADKEYLIVRRRILFDEKEENISQ